MEKGSNFVGGFVLIIYGFFLFSYDWSKVCLFVYWVVRFFVCLLFSLFVCGYKKKIRLFFMNYKSCLFVFFKLIDGKEVVFCFYIYFLNVLCNYFKFFFLNVFKIVLDWF